MEEKRRTSRLFGLDYVSVIQSDATLVPDSSQSNDTALTYLQHLNNELASMDQMLEDVKQMENEVDQMRSNRIVSNQCKSVELNSDQKQFLDTILNPDVVSAFVQRYRNKLQIQKKMTQLKFKYNSDCNKFVDAAIQDAIRLN